MTIKLFGVGIEITKRSSRQVERLVRLQPADPIFVDDVVLPLPAEGEKAFRRKEFELIDEDISEMIVENKDSISSLDMERIIRLQTLRLLRQLTKV